MSNYLCIVEDDPTIRDIVGSKLAGLGYRVQSFEHADDLMANPQGLGLYDCFVLDLLLPGKAQGTDLCRVVRQQSPTVPVLILSALSDPQDRVEGLKSGADDYLTKPFEMEELLLRVQGMLRRRAWYSTLVQQDEFAWDANRVHFGNLEAQRGKETHRLSAKEAMLMKLLVEREGEVVTRDQILDRVWGYHVYPSSRTVDNFIVRLRRLFERDPEQPQYILSVRGKGYRFRRSA